MHNVRKDQIIRDFSDTQSDVPMMFLYYAEFPASGITRALCRSMDHILEYSDMCYKHGQEAVEITSSFETNSTTSRKPTTASGTAKKTSDANCLCMTIRWAQTITCSA